MAKKKEIKHYPGGYDPSNFDINVSSILKYYSLDLRYYNHAAEKIFQVLNGKINPIIQCRQFFIELYSSQLLGKCISTAVIIYMNMIIRNALFDMYKFSENDPNLNIIAHDNIMCELLYTIAHELGHFNQKHAFSGDPNDESLYLYVEEANENYINDYLRTNLDWIEQATGFRFNALRYKFGQFDIDHNYGLYPQDLKIARPHSFTNYRFYDVEEYIAIELANLLSSDNFDDDIFQRYVKMIKESENIFFSGSIKASEDVCKSPFKDFSYTTEATPLKLNWFYEGINKFVDFIANIYGDIVKPFTTCCTFKVKTSYCTFSNSSLFLNALYIEISSSIDEYMPVVIEKNFLSDDLVNKLQNDIIRY